MAKTELSGKVTAFRQSKFKQDSYQTIVQMASVDVASKAIGARAVWLREDGVRILGRVVARHGSNGARSEEHTSELQSRLHLVCRLLLEKKKKKQKPTNHSKIEKSRMTEPGDSAYARDEAP